MSEETGPNPAADPDDDSQEEEPIEHLKELEQDTSPFFLTNVRRRIHRRTTASQLLSFSWQLPRIAFVELGSMMAHVLSSLTIRKRD